MERYKQLTVKLSELPMEGGQSEAFVRVANKKSSRTVLLEGNRFSQQPTSGVKINQLSDVAFRQNRYCEM